LRAIVFDTGSQKKERKKKKKENEQSSGFKARGKLDQDCFNSTLTRHQAAVGRQKNHFFSPGCAIQPGIEKVLLPAASSTFTVAMGQ